MGKVIAIASQKGGVGKTTTSINLGVCLAIFKKKILVIDMDPQGSVAETFHLTSFEMPMGLYDIFVKKIPLSMAITDIGLENFNIVSSNVENEIDETDLYAAALDLNRLSHIINPYRKLYDYILIDCPPSLGSLTMNALIAADAVIIPVQCEYYALKSLEKFLRSIETISHKFNKRLKVYGILITMFDGRIKKNKEIAEELKRSFKKLLFETKIPRNSKLAEAPSVGKPIVFYDINSKGAISYLSLAEEVVNK